MPDYVWKAARADASIQDGRLSAPRVEYLPMSTVSATVSGVPAGTARPW